MSNALPARCDRWAYQCCSMSGLVGTRRSVSFGIQHVKAFLEIGEEFIAAPKPLRIEKTHVVGIEAAGNDQMRPRRSDLRISLQRGGNTEYRSRGGLGDIWLRSPRLPRSESSARLSTARSCRTPPNSPGRRSG